ncbi:MAG: hypothetical protein H7067_17445, partial [Burkholderiales bacterium]|nr:hypothetical protein [Opitutaceae bacterium]
TTNADRIHFDPSGQLALGRAFAARLGPWLVLRASSIQSGPDGFDLTWNAAPLRRYLIQTSPNLRDWTSFPVGATATWRDDPTFTPPAPGGRFYRVAEQD